MPYQCHKICTRNSQSPHAYIKKHVLATIITKNLTYTPATNEVGYKV